MTGESLRRWIIETCDVPHVLAEHDLGACLRDDALVFGSQTWMFDIEHPATVGTHRHHIQLLLGPHASHENSSHRCSMPAQHHWLMEDYLENENGYVGIRLVVDLDHPAKPLPNHLNREMEY